MTLSELRAALSAYVHRDESTTVENEPNAIRFAQLALSRSLFVREGYAIATVAMVNGAGVLPVDFGRADSVAVAEGALEYVAPQRFVELTAANMVADAYTLAGPAIRAGASVGDITLGYWAKPAALVNGADTNWLSLNYSDVFLWMAVAQQHRFLQDFEAASVAERFAVDLAGAAEQSSTAANQSGGALKIKGH